MKYYDKNETEMTDGCVVQYDHSGKTHQVLTNAMGNLYIKVGAGRLGETWSLGVRNLDMEVV